MSNKDTGSARYRHSQTGEANVQKQRGIGAYTEPGRTPNEDSLDASREENPRDDDGYDYTGFETPAATQIGDGSDDDPKMERLRKHHEGRHQSDGEHSARETERDKERIAQAVCSALPLNQREKEHVVAAVKNLDLDRFGNQKSITKVTLGVVAVLIDENYREGVEDFDQLVRRSEEFCEIRDKHGISMSDLNTVKEIVRDTLGSQPVPVHSEVRRRDPALPGPTTPSDLSAQYWDELPAESWVSIARTWERKSEEYRSAIPSEYKDLIKLLRKWQPWTDVSEAETQDAVPYPDESSDFDDKDLAAEVEELIEELSADDASDNE